MDKEGTYRNTFIQVSEDCPAPIATEPPPGGLAGLEFSLLADAPYRYTQDELQFATYLAHKKIPESENDQARKEYFSKPHACLRASPLAKRWGWGFHFDEKGKVALVGLGSPEYQAFLADKALQQLKGMRNKRA